MKNILVLLCLTVFGFAQVDLRDSTKSNLVSQWVLDSTYANPNTDHSGSYDLVEIGNVKYVAESATYPGGYSAVNFSALNYFRTTTAYQIQTLFTVSIWFKRSFATNPNKNMRLVNCDNSSTLRNWFVFYHNTSQTILFDVFINNTVKFVSFNVSGSAFWEKYFNNEWHNFTAVHNGITIEVYLDGVKSTNSASAVGIVDSDAVQLSIGASPTGLEPFDGQIDLVEIFDIALSREEILQNIKNYRNKTKFPKNLSFPKNY